MILIWSFEMHLLDTKNVSHKLTFSGQKNGVPKPIFPKPHDFMSFGTAKWCFITNVYGTVLLFEQGQLPYPHK